MPHDEMSEQEAQISLRPRSKQHHTHRVKRQGHTNTRAWKCHLPRTSRSIEAPIRSTGAMRGINPLLHGPSPVNAQKPETEFDGNIIHIPSRITRIQTHSSVDATNPKLGKNHPSGHQTFQHPRHCSEINVRQRRRPTHRPLRYTDTDSSAMPPHVEDRTWTPPRREIRP